MGCPSPSRSCCRFSCERGWGREEFGTCRELHEITVKLQLMIKSCQFLQCCSSCTKNPNQVTARHCKHAGTTSNFLLMTFTRQYPNLETIFLLRSVDCIGQLILPKVSYVEQSYPPALWVITTSNLPSIAHDIACCNGSCTCTVTFFLSK